MLDPRQDNRFQFPPPRGGELAASRSAHILSRFQFPPPRGGEPGACTCFWLFSQFQFPPPRGGEQGTSFLAGPGLYFNSRPREGANGRGWYCSQVLSNFNSRPREGANRDLKSVCRGPPEYSRPREGANRDCTPCSVGLLSLFPPPRGGEPGHGQDLGLRCHAVLIPAPARGRTGSKTAQNRAVYLVSLLKFGRISAILPYILSATRAKKRETPKIIGFLLRRPTGRSCMEQVGAGGVR